jgi:hypothetical protein
MRKIQLALVVILVLASITIASNKYIAKADDPTNLRGMWHFDEGTGTTAKDSSGNGNDGTIYGATYTATSHVGKALDFDGADDYVEVPDASSLRITGTLTLDAWIYPRSIGSTSQTTKVIVQKDDPTTNGTGHVNNGYYLALGGSGTYDKIYFALSSTGSDFTGMWSTTTPPLNAWTHVTAVYNGTYMIIYINGVKDNTRAYVLGVYASNAPLRIGRFGYYVSGSQYDRWFDGIIDDVMVSTSSTPTVLSSSPNPVMKQEGVDTYFDLSIDVSSITNLYAFDIQITWDNTYLNYVSYDTTSLGGVWSSYQIADQENGAGYFELAATAWEGASAFTGTHELFTVRFEVLGGISNSIKQTPIHFATDKLSDSTPAAIDHTTVDGLYQITGLTPTIGFTSASSQTCHKHSDPFDVTIGISTAENVMGFDFEVDFDSTMLDCLGGALGAVWTGTCTVGSGKITINAVSGDGGQNGTLTVLVTIHFQSSSTYWHIWKHSSITPWTNDVTNDNAIYIQSADLAYTGAPTLYYVKGGSSNGITVNPDHVSYMFSPLKGDINNDGKINIYDLTTLCHLYGDKPGRGWDTAGPYDLVLINNEQIIDIYDIVIIASSYTG